MTKPDAPLLIVVTGPPASGKTTLASALAEELRLPLLAKDEIKETLFDVLGTGERRWGRRLGHATFAVLFAVAAQLLRAGRPLVFEGNFARGPAEAEFRALPPHRLVQVVCSAPPELILARYRERAHGGGRHEGHLDVQLEDELAAALREGRHEALELPGERIDVDATSPPSVEPIVARVRRLLAADA
jgi:predicted kinase